LRSDLPIQLPSVSALTGSVDSQGRPILLAGVSNSYPPCEGHSSIEPLPRAIVRLTATGNADPSFGGGDGVSPMSDRTTPDYGALGLADGEQPMAAAGSVGCRGVLLFRLDANGSPSPGYGAGGVLYRNKRFGTFGRSGALILRVGSPTREVIWIGPDGRRDKSFGKDGGAPVEVPAGVRRNLRPVAVDDQGRLVLVGSFVVPAKKGGVATDGRKRRGYFLAMRLLPSGKPDLGFGNRGRMVRSVGVNRQVLVKQAALDPQGRLVVLNVILAGRVVVERVLARYLL
jgi:hypothetical protein